jgi:hypothetical protein
MVKENDRAMFRRILEYMIITKNCEPVIIKQIAEGVSSRRDQIKIYMSILKEFGMVKEIKQNDNLDVVRYFPTNIMQVKSLEDAKMKGINLRDRTEVNGLLNSLNKGEDICCFEECHGVSRHDWFDEETGQTYKICDNCYNSMIKEHGVECPPEVVTNKTQSILSSDTLTKDGDTNGDKERI